MKTKLYPDLKCPNCGSDRIHFEDVYDIESIEIEGEESIASLCVGVCRKCGTYIQWQQVYKFAGVRDIETIEE